jgi:2-oxoglutarate dehydrogenase E2 component (dihydrolipoamide succinyltransferase)
VLLVPVVRNADRKTLLELDQAVADLGARAKRGTSRRTSCRGGPSASPIRARKGNLFVHADHPPAQVGILRMGRSSKRPVVATVAGEDAIVIRPMMYRVWRTTTGSSTVSRERLPVSGSGRSSRRGNFG